jgi:hypothetical protein
MKITAVVAGMILLAASAVAQEPSPVAESDGSVAAAARASQARVQEQRTKQEDIRRLLALTGAANLATQFMDTMEKDVRPLVTNALPPGEYRDQLVQLFFDKFHSKLDSGQLIDLVVPIYDKYYSDDEVKQLIQLYQTPIGQKMLAVLPKITKESQEAGENWGQALGRECMQEVLAEHPDLKAQLIEAGKRSQMQP